MKRNFLQKNVVWFFGVLALISWMAWGETAHAANKVVVIPQGSSIPVPVTKTGQTTSYAAGDDGALEKGVGITTGRFVDNNNGTVTDRRTGLIWLKDGKCSTFFSGDWQGKNERTWAAALNSVSKLAIGHCGLADGSKAGDWRLPNKNELETLVAHENLKFIMVGSVKQEWSFPADCPLDVSFAHAYWSSTTIKDPTTKAWGIEFYYGTCGSYFKSDNHFVLPVRGGQ